MNKWQLGVYQTMRKWIAMLLFTSIIFFDGYSQDLDMQKRIYILRSAIHATLRETHAPGAGIAIVTKDSVLFVAGMGKADIGRDIDATGATLFRIASISKMFVALSILKLQEGGKLNLEDKVRDIAPEIAFENPWEDTDPVRIVHLLEHTTGWDDYHLVEQTDVPLTLKQGLDLHPHSRRSRWVPGSRMAYSNSGSGVAGYIVEKISGQPYEQYVEENFFRPLKMSTSTFFNDERYRKWGATLYDHNLRAVNYRHQIQRPAGAINSSAKEMANFVRFFLNRGSADSTRLIEEKSLMRMERTKSTPAADAGLELGYGLASFTTVHHGFVYHGHNGSLPGALAELAYLPEHGIGHIILLNATKVDAFTAISNLIRDFEIEMIKPDSVSIAEAPPQDFLFTDGYYVSINPRIQWGYFIDRLIDVYRFTKVDSHLVKSWLLPGASEVFYPVSDSTFRSPGLDRVSLVRSIDPIEGEVLVTDSRVYKPISAFIVFGQLGVLAAWIGMMGIGSMVWVIALARYWSKRSRDWLRVARYPMVTTVLFFVTAFVLIYVPRNYNEAMVSVGLLSLMIMGFSVWLIVSTLLSVVVMYKSWNKAIPRLVYWPLAVLSVLHLMVTAYLVWFDVLPVVTWG